MLAFFRTFRMVLLFGRLGALALVLVAGCVVSAVHHISDSFAFRQVPARIDRLSVTCTTPDGDADCGVLSAMGGKQAVAADRHTTVHLRYFSPADGREHDGAVERDGDLSDTLRPGGAIQISADLSDPDKIR